MIYSSVLNRLFLFSCLWLLSSGSCIASPFLDAVNECLKQTFASETPVNISQSFDVGQVCPDVILSVDEDATVDFLNIDNLQTSSPNGLLDIQALLNETHAAPVNLPSLDDKMLEGILAEVVLSHQTETLSWWEQFKNWLKSFYKDNPEMKDSWLIDFLNTITLPEWLGEIIYYVSIGIILLMALGMLVYEFRQTRFRKHRQLKSTALSFASGKNTAIFDVVIPLEEIPQLPELKQPSALLSLVIHSMIERQLLPNNLSFTNNEFLHTIKVKNLSLRDHFAQIIACAEASFYGDTLVNQEDLDSLYRSTNMILAYQTNGIASEG